MISNNQQIKINGFSLEVIDMYTKLKTLYVLESFFKEYPKKAIDIKGYIKIKEVAIKETKEQLHIVNDEV